jgi:hypothetical protein
MIQKTRHANLRPYRSASFPVNDAETAPARNPVMNSAATTSSASPFSSVRPSSAWFPRLVVLETGVKSGISEVTIEQTNNS